MAYADLEAKRINRRKHQTRLAEANMALSESFMQECLDCGNDDPDVLEWDHEYAAPGPLRTVIRAAVSSRSAMLTEIAKCEVRCCNCHRKRHREEARCG